MKPENDRGPALRNDGGPVYPGKGADAVISQCGLYRYRLMRRWADGPICLFVMLNPSTADASLDDPTIRRCIGFAKREGCGALSVINLFTLRTPSPAELAAHPYPHGPHSTSHAIEAIAETDGPVICGWGADPMARSVSAYMLDMIRAFKKTPMCLGLTKNGAPKHPLYLKKDAALIEFSADAMLAAREAGDD